MGPRLRIASLTTADLDAAARLHVLHSGGETDALRTRLADELTRPDRRLFGARWDDGPVIGYGRITRFHGTGAPREAPGGHYLGGVVVDPRHRGHGIGTALTTTRMSVVFGETDTVWYFANARNQASIAMHRRLGFAEVTKDFHYPGVSFDGGVGILFRADRSAAAG